MGNKMKTVKVPASQYEDHDDCLEAAVTDYVEMHPEAKGWNLHARWEDGTRDVILIDVPVT